MTFEEIQKAIEGMLAVGRDLQERQLELQERQDRLQAQQERETERVNERFERFEREIDRMLAVQRELQESQIYLKDQQERERETIAILRDEVFKLIEAANRSDRRIEQLIGYSIANESDRLNYLERVIKLEERVSRLENQN